MKFMLSRDIRNSDKRQAGKFVSVSQRRATTMTATTTLARPPSPRQLSPTIPRRIVAASRRTACTQACARKGAERGVGDQIRRGGTRSSRGSAAGPGGGGVGSDALSCCCWWVVAVMVVVSISGQVGREDLHVAERRGRCTPLRPAAASVSFRPRSRTVVLGERVTLLHRRRRRRDRCDSYAGLLFIATARRALGVDRAVRRSARRARALGHAVEDHLVIAEYGIDEQKRPRCRSCHAADSGFSGCNVS